MTEHSADTVERVAKTMWESRGNANTWDDTTNTALVGIYRNLARAALSALTVEDAAKGGDTELLDAIAANYWDLKCIDVPTGGGDADIDWIVVEHHMGKKGDVTIAQAYTDDPRAAVLRAIAGTPKEGE